MVRQIDQSTSQPAQKFDAAGALPLAGEAAPSGRASRDLFFQRSASSCGYGVRMALSKSLWTARAKPVAAPRGHLREIEGFQLPQSNW